MRAVLFRICAVLLLISLLGAGSSAPAQEAGGKISPGPGNVKADLAALVQALKAEPDLKADWRKVLRRLAPGRLAAWKEAAGKGSPEGMVLLGNCVHLGVGVAQHDQEAAR